MILSNVLTGIRVTGLDTRRSAVHVESGHPGLTTMIALLHLPSCHDDQVSGSLRLVAESVIRERLRQRSAEDPLWNGGGDVRVSHDYRTARCEIEVPADCAESASASLAEAVSAPVSAAEAAACYDAEREVATRPIDHLRFALQGALFPDHPRLAFPPGVPGRVPSDEIARTISAAKVYMVSVGSRTPWRTARMPTDPFASFPPSVSRWSMPDPDGQTMHVGRTVRGGQMGRLVVAFRLPGPSNAEWPLSLLLHAMLGSGTAGRVNGALRGGPVASYGANVQLAVLDQEAVLVSEVRFVPRHLGSVLTSLQEAFFPDEIAASWANFAREAALSRLEMLPLSPGRLADALATAIGSTGTMAGLEAVPSLLAELTIDEIREFCSRHLTRGRIRVGLEGGIPDGIDVQTAVMEQFFGTR